jgi:DNA-binding protein Fis
MHLCEQSVTKAADVLGLDRSHLHTKLKELGIK